MTLIVPVIDYFVWINEYTACKDEEYIFIIQLFGVDKQPFLPSRYMQWHNEDKKSKIIIS